MISAISSGSGRRPWCGGPLNASSALRCDYSYLTDLQDCSDADQRIHPLTDRVVDSDQRAKAQGLGFLIINGSGHGGESHEMRIYDFQFK